MKWYKHESNCHSDEKVMEIICEFGMEGYGLYHLCLELISEKIDGKLEAKITISDRVLRKKSQLSHRKLTKILLFFDQISVISSNFSEKFWQLECRNLLKRLDNHTRNLQVTDKQVSPNKNKNKNKNKSKSSSNTLFDSKTKKAWFVEVWDKYPNKVGRQKAEKYYLSTVKTEKDKASCQDTLEIYLAHLAVNTWKEPQNGSTWFNQWEDWIGFKEPEKQKSKDDEILAKLGVK